MGLDDASAIFVFGHLAGKALDHQHRFLAAGDDQVEIALFKLVLGGEGDDLAVHVPSRTEPMRPLERQRRNAQRGRGPVHRQHVGVVLPIAGHHEGLHLHLVVEPLGKQRADGPVDQPRGERFLGRRASFAFEEPAGEFARAAATRSR